MTCQGSPLRAPQQPCCRNRPLLDAPDMPRARSRAERSDPPRLHAQALRDEGGTHSEYRLVSAESELGTLPVSALFLSKLHARGGLGRSAVLRRTHSNDVPYGTRTL